MADVVDHFYTKLFTYSHFWHRVAIGFPVPAIRKDIRFNFTKFGHNTPVFWIFRVTGQNNTVDGPKPLDDFFALFFGHEFSTLLMPQPVVIVENNHKLIPELLRFIEHAYMPDVYRVKPTAHRNYYLLFNFSHF